MCLLFFLLGVIYKVLDNALGPARCNDAVAWLIYWWVLFFVLRLSRRCIDPRVKTTCVLVVSYRSFNLRKVEF